MRSKKNIWEKVQLDLGERQENTKVKFAFKALTDPNIERIKVGCSSCTKVLGYNEETKELEVVYDIAAIPRHLRHKPGYHLSRKVIQLFYKDKTNEILTFITQVKKK